MAAPTYSANTAVTAAMKIKIQLAAVPTSVAKRSIASMDVAPCSIGGVRPRSLCQHATPHGHQTSADDQGSVVVGFRAAAVASADCQDGQDESEDSQGTPSAGKDE